MFAPDGYISLDEIFNHLRDMAHEWRLSTPHQDDPNPGPEYVDGSFFPVDLNSIRQTAYSHWLFQCFLNRHENELYAALPNGSVVKLSLSVAQRFKIFDGPFEDAKDAWSSIVEHVADSFTFISETGYVINLDHAEAWVHDDRLQDVRNTLGMINGCPVCWKTPGGNKKLDWREICGVSHRHEKDNRDLSIKAISKRILSEKKLNPSLTRDEVKELVAPTVSYRHFRAAWLLAAQEYPSISKPGRKS